MCVHFSVLHILCVCICTLHNNLGFLNVNVFTINQMCYYMYLLLIKCVIICDINTVVNIKDSFTMAEMPHIQYLHTHLHHILINSK